MCGYMHIRIIMCATIDPIDLSYIVHTRYTYKSIRSMVQQVHVFLCVVIVIADIIIMVLFYYNLVLSL